MNSKQKGFTLIESLVVIGVLAVLGYVMTDLLSRTLQGGNKTELVATIKQNGDRSLNLMSTTIRNSDQVVCVGSVSNPGDLITVVTGGLFTRFQIYYQTGSSNGYIGEDQPTLTDPTKTAGLCDGSIPQSSSTNEQIINDQNTTTGVSVSPGPGSPTPAVFNWTPNPGFKDVVGISFYLSPGISAGSGAQNTVGTNNQVNFSTSVELR